MWREQSFQQRRRFRRVLHGETLLRKPRNEIAGLQVACGEIYRDAAIIRTTTRWLSASFHVLWLSTMRAMNVAVAIGRIVKLHGFSLGSQ